MRARAGSPPWVVRSSCRVFGCETLKAKRPWPAFSGPRPPTRWTPIRWRRSRPGCPRVDTPRPWTRFPKRWTNMASREARSRADLWRCRASACTSFFPVPWPSSTPFSSHPIQLIVALAANAGVAPSPPAATQSWRVRARTDALRDGRPGCADVSLGAECFVVTPSTEGYPPRGKRRPPGHPGRETSCLFRTARSRRVAPSGTRSRPPSRGCTRGRTWAARR